MAGTSKDFPSTAGEVTAKAPVTGGDYPLLPPSSNPSLIRITHSSEPAPTGAAPSRQSTMDVDEFLATVPPGKVTIFLKFTVPTNAILPESPDGWPQMFGTTMALPFRVDADYFFDRVAFPGLESGEHPSAKNLILLAILQNYGDVGILPAPDAIKHFKTCTHCVGVSQIIGHTWPSIRKIEELADEYVGKGELEEVLLPPHIKYTVIEPGLIAVQQIDGALEQIDFTVQPATQQPEAPPPAAESETNRTGTTDKHLISAPKRNVEPT